MLRGRNRVGMWTLLRFSRLKFNYMLGEVWQKTPEVIPLLSFVAGTMVWASYYYGRRLLWDYDMSMPNYPVESDTTVMYPRSRLLNFWEKGEDRTVRPNVMQPECQGVHRDVVPYIKVPVVADIAPLTDLEAAIPQGRPGSAV